MMAMKENRKRIRLNDSIVKEQSITDSPTREILNDDCLLYIFEYLPIIDRIRLERVNKRWCTVSKKSWQRCKTLTFTNDDWGCQNEEEVTKKTLKKVLHRCGKYLKKLDMSVTPVLAEKVDFSSLLKLCPNLTSADFTSVRVGVPLIKSLVEDCKSIVDLRIGLTTSYVTGQLINDTVLSTYTNLQVLHLDTISFTDGSINLKNTISMKELKLEYCSICVSRFAEPFPQLQNLHTLSLRRCFDTCESFAGFDFTKIPNLKELDIFGNCWAVDDSFLIQLASSCAHLTSLDIGDNHDVTDDGLRAILSSCNIEHLSIDSFWDTSRVTGSCLSNVPSLKKLSCKFCTDLDPQYFKNMFETSDKLEVINLHGVDEDRVNDIIQMAMESIRSRKNDITLRIYVYPNVLATDIDVADLPDNLELVEDEINIII